MRHRGCGRTQGPAHALRHRPADIIEAADFPPGGPGPIGLRKYTFNDRGYVRKVQSALQESSDGDFIRRIENGRRQPASVRYSPSQSKTGEAGHVGRHEVQLPRADQVQEISTGLDAFGPGHA